MFDKCIKVLLVEDSQGYTRLIMELLNEGDTAQFGLEWVGRLDQALKRLAEEAFDAVLLDLGLPDGQGRGAQQGVRSAARSVDYCADRFC